MKKFYEAPVVELTGFSAEDVITTSALTPIDTKSMTEVEASVFTGYNGVSSVNKYTGTTGSYNW